MLRRITSVRLLPGLWWRFAGDGRYWIIGAHGEPLAVEHRRLAAPLAFNQGSTNPGGLRRVVQWARGEAQLHAESGIAFAQHDDRPQLGELHIVRLQQTAP